MSRGLGLEPPRTGAWAILGAATGWISMLVVVGENHGCHLSMDSRHQAVDILPSPDWEPAYQFPSMLFHPIWTLWKVNQEMFKCTVDVRAEERQGNRALVSLLRGQKSIQWHSYPKLRHTDHGAHSLLQEKQALSNSTRQNGRELLTSNRHQSTLTGGLGWKQMFHAQEVTLGAFLPQLDCMLW